MSLRTYAFVLCVLFLRWASAQDITWESINVPGAWEKSGISEAEGYDGHAWYRTWVLPDKDCFKSHERNLYQESVGITVRGLADSHEVFVNGRKIGIGGKMPPVFESGRELNLRHKIPPKVLLPEAWNEIVFHVFNNSDEGGFTSEPPVITTYSRECQMAGAWQIYFGADPPQFIGIRTEKPFESAFSDFQQATTGLEEAVVLNPGPRLSPDKAATKLKTVNDLVCELLVHEPLVAQPTHFSFDARGRLWVANYRQYPYPAGVKVLSRDQYYRSIFDKVPPAPPNHDIGRDSVTIHEDRNGDGYFDHHKEFVSGLNMVTSALRGHEGVWVLNPPYLLFYPDVDGDDIPDSSPIVHLSGFGLEDTHSTANSLTWGPDGWLYGGQGSTTTSKVKRPGLDSLSKPVSAEGAMVWRYHPQTRHYEIFATGGGNLWGLEFDSHGRLFSGTNAGGSRGYHYVQGGIHGKASSNRAKYGPSRHPFSFGELMAMPSTNPIPRFSHIAAVVEGTALPSIYSGDLFCIDPLHSKVIDARRLPVGSSFKTTDRGDVLTSEDEAFRPVFISNAPDGSLFLADFYDFYIAHGQHYQSQIDNTTGRIYRLRGKETSLEDDVKLHVKPNTELVGLLSHPNKWHRQMAVRLLGERKALDVVPRLQSIIKHEEGQAALNALWALHQITGLDESVSQLALGHSFGPVREWTIRLHGDVGQVPASLVETFEILAQEDENLHVLSQLACTARRLPTRQSLRLVESLLRRGPDVARDPYLPLLIWWALEECVHNDAQKVLRLFQDKEIWDKPIVRNTILSRIMRRWAASGKHSDLVMCAALLEQAPSKEHAKHLLAGFSDAYEGRAMAHLPDELLAAMSRFGDAPLLVRLKQGQKEAYEQSIRALKDPSIDLTTRLSLVRALGELKVEQAIPVLFELASSDEASTAKAAFSALATFDNESIAAKTVVILPRLDESVRSSALMLMTERVEAIQMLLSAIEEKDIALSLIPDEIISLLRQYQNEDVRAHVDKIFPRSQRDLKHNAQDEVERLKKIIMIGGGNAYQGEVIFGKKCSACHTLFFKGGRVGPDLTLYQRDNLSTMLNSIVHPSAEIREGYEYQMVMTHDGRSVGGFIIEHGIQNVVVRGLDGENLVLAQNTIEEILPVGRSLMPDGLMDDLSDKQICDLFAFLQRSQPITQ
ncbi:MAG: PVC-type heme-binding CxxCH protein [Pirellulales bacterium]